MPSHPNDTTGPGMEAHTNEEQGWVLGQGRHCCHRPLFHHAARGELCLPLHLSSTSPGLQASKSWAACQIRLVLA